MEYLDLPVSISVVFFNQRYSSFDKMLKIISRIRSERLEGVNSHLLQYKRIEILCVLASIVLISAEFRKLYIEAEPTTCVIRLER